MEKMKNVPRLRFPEFRDQWVKSKLKDVGTFKNGINKSNEDFGHGVPFVNLMDVFGKPTISELKLGLVNANENEIINYELKKGDVLFIRSSVKKTGVGETSLILENLKNTVYSGFLIRFRDDIIGFSLYFKKYCFATKRFRENLMSLSTTSANTNINQESLNELELYYPVIQEQAKIADFLSEVDNLTTFLKKKKNLLEQYKKGVMQQIFSQEWRFKDVDGNYFSDWEEKKLTDFAEIIGGGTPDTLNQEFWNGEIEWFTPTELKTKYVSQSIRKITKEGLQQSSAKILPIGSVLFTSRATVGDVSISLKKCATNQGFQSFVVNESNCNEFLYYWICFNKNEFISRASGSTFLEVSKSEMQKIKVLRPSLPEQQKIASFLSALDDKIAQTALQIEKMQLWKKGLLQQMFC
ncbi:MAG TPA: restriction endonuclease subunit S [Bacteroidales bacterium]|nr:restriction endonuclease subunit S [Bacteroidales bacterium]